MKLAVMQQRTMTGIIFMCVAWLAAVAAAQCPLVHGLACSGHGQCPAGQPGAGARCACAAGWAGVACERRSCPSAGAWVGFARGVDDVHAVARPCAAAGECDGASGACVCQAGFTGAACERLACPGDCNGHGTCQTLRRAAPAYVGWDADRVQGCVCDAGWHGADCSERRCPAGADPWDAASRSRLTEMQTLSCACQANEGAGNCSDAWLVLEQPPVPGRRPTVRVRVRATAVAAAADEVGEAGSGSGPGESLAAALAEADAAISSITYAAAGPLCMAAALGGNVATITYATRAGDAPQLQAREVGAPLHGNGSVAVAANHSASDDAWLQAALQLGINANTTASVAGQLQLAVATLHDGRTTPLTCSGRGLCDSATGSCLCAAGFGPSDGDGGPGALADCGFNESGGSGNSSGSSGNVSAACPTAATTATAASGGLAASCGGRGTCSGAPAWSCACAYGYAGAACELVLCPRARAWFAVPAADGTGAHGLTECAGRGVCQHDTGVCICTPGFTGAACDRSVCPGAGAAGDCNDVGRCLPLRDLAALGRAGGAPRGDVEVQALECSLAAGAFALALRYAATVPLDAAATTAADLLIALEALPSVGAGALAVDTGAGAVCVPGGGARTLITWRGARGSPPLLVPIVDAAASGAGGSLTVSRLRTGSRASYGDAGEDDARAEEATWDADALHGCYCDGYPDANKTLAAGADVAAADDRGAREGPACAARSCPYGSDPLAARRATAPAEQLLICTATAGSLTLSWRGDTTAPIGADVGADGLRDALQALPAIGAVAVDLADGAMRMCSANAATARIRFLTELGDLPLLEVGAAHLISGSATVTAVAGTGGGTNEECSGRGTCGEGGRQEAMVNQTQPPRL